MTNMSLMLILLKISCVHDPCSLFTRLKISTEWKKRGILIKRTKIRLGICVGGEFGTFHTDANSKKTTTIVIVDEYDDDVGYEFIVTHNY